MLYKSLITVRIDLDPEGLMSSISCSEWSSQQSRAAGNFCLQFTNGLAAHISAGLPVRS